MISTFKYILLIFNILNAQGYTLEDCIQISFNEKKTVLSADIGVVSAIKGLKASYSGVLPSVQAPGASGVNYFPWQESFNINLEEITLVNLEEFTLDTTRTNHFNTFSAGIAVNQVIYDGGRSWNQIKQARTNLDIAKYLSLIHI